MSDKIRAGDSKKAISKKPSAADDEQADSASGIKKPGNNLLWLLLGGVALFLFCGLPMVGIGLGVAVYLLRAPANAPNVPLAAVKLVGEKPDLTNPKEEKPADIKQPKKVIEKKEIEKKPPPVEIGKAPWGKAAVDDLDPELQLWDFMVRLPKGYALLGDKKNPRDIYQWRQQGGQHHMDIARVRLVGVDPVVLFKQDPQKSGPKDLVQFEVYRGPQQVLINGMHGVRQWRWSGSLGIPDGAVIVSYRFEVDGWHYVLNGTAQGKSRDEAEKTAAIMDQSLCTFRKR